MTKLDICKNCENVRYVAEEWKGEDGYVGLWCDLRDKEVEAKHSCQEWGERIATGGTLREVHKTYKRLLYIEDTKRIDVVLAAALSHKMKGIPIWLVVVGASGDMKSVQINAIRGEGCFIMHNLTSKTLVNGYKNKKEHPDLAPLLDNKIVIIPDMAQILKLPAAEKAELWGQLRDLYDGFAGKCSGEGSTAEYEGLKVTMIAGSTPNIDAQILIHQDLGTRELIYRTKGNDNKEKVMRKCMENEETEEEITQELKDITTGFLDQTEIKRFDVPEKTLKRIMKLALYITYMRATAEFDGYTNELRNIVYPEEPTRIVKQLKRLYICLKSLEKNYPDEKAFAILEHLAKSCSFPVRTKIFGFLRKNKDEKCFTKEGEEVSLDYSTSELAEIFKVGKSTIKRECVIMENMGLILCRRVETTYPDRFYEYWRFPKKPSIDIIYSIPTHQRKKKKKVYSSIISGDGSKKEKKEDSTHTKLPYDKIDDFIMEQLKSRKEYPAVELIQLLRNSFKIPEKEAYDIINQKVGKGEINEIRNGVLKLME